MGKSCKPAVTVQRDGHNHIVHKIQVTKLIRALYNILHYYYILDSHNVTNIEVRLGLLGSDIIHLC